MNKKSSRAESSKLIFDAIGTQWEIETQEPLTSKLTERIFERIDVFDKTYSRFRDDSLVAQIADSSYGGCFSFPEDSEPLFSFYDQLHAATQGAVDPLVGRDLELLGYDRKYTLRPAIMETPTTRDMASKPSWINDVARRQSCLITVGPVNIDVGAAGKGYLVDLVFQLLREAGLQDFVVDGSGDMRHYGGRPLRVGLQHPYDSGLVVGVVSLKNQALCASSTTRRRWGNGLHHVIDARNGKPVQGVVATWVVADDALTADGIATALFFETAAQLQEKFIFSGVRMFEDGRIEASHNFGGELYT